MIKKRWPWLLIIILAAVAAYISGRLMQPAYTPVIYIVGDVEKCLETNDIDKLGDLQQVDFDSDTYQAVTLADVVAAAQPAAQTKRVLMIADDGFSVEIAGDTLDDCWLTFTPKDGWRVLAPLHPLSANGTHIWRIVVVADSSSQTALTVTAGGETSSFTIGQLYAGTTISFPYPEGTAEKATDDVVYSSTVYTRRDCLTLAQLGCDEAAEIQINAANGQSLTVNSSETGLFQLNGNSLSYINAIQRKQMEDVDEIVVLK